jgi:integrase
MLPENAFSGTVRFGNFRKNTARLVKQLKENERTFHVISDAEQKRYSLAAPPLLSDIFNLMLETGLRCGEAYGLKRGDINLNGKYLKVTKGKTKSSIRRVPLSDKAKNFSRVEFRDLTVIIFFRTMT